MCVQPILNTALLSFGKFARLIVCHVNLLNIASGPEEHPHSPILHEITA